MTLQTIAYKNVKYRLPQYLSYFFSCTFAVWLFFQYISLLFHPILKEEVVTDHLVTLLYLVQAFLVLFSFLFIGYSQSAFLRVRKKEIGLLQVLGMEVRHVTRLLFWENMIIGLSAILLGIGLGFITSKLFFMLVTRVLEIKEIIPFNFSISAIFITVALFLFLFGSISLWNRFSIHRISIAEIFRQSVKPKKAPTFSLGWLILGIGSLGIAYTLLWKTNLTELMNRIPWIFILIIIGTYLAFTQISVVIVEKLSQTKSIYFRGKNLFILSELRFRLKDNARTFFMVAILCSIVLSSVGVTFSYYLEAERLAMEQSPYHLNIIGEPGEVTPEVVKREMKVHKISLTDEWHLPIIDLSDQSIQGLPRLAYVTSESTLNQLLTNQQIDPIKLKKDEALFSRSSGVWKGGLKSIPAYQVQLGSQNVRTNHEYHGTIFNESIVTTNLLVVSDPVYKQLKKEFPKSQFLVHAYRFSDWKASDSLLNDLTQQIEQKEKRKIYPYETLNGTVITYQLIKDIFAPLMFISLLIGILFFLASGSILYFRVFTEIENDRKLISVLYKLGISSTDSKGILGWQIRLLFYLPFFVGLIHSFFALRLFGQLFNQPIWNTSFIIAISYLIVYSIYYRWAKRKYIQSAFDYFA